MQVHESMSQIPARVPGGSKLRTDPWRDWWPGALSSRESYRGTRLRTQSSSTGHNARAFVTATLADWRLLAILDDAVLCVSELVGNAVQHAVQTVTGPVDDWCVSLGLRCWPSTLLVEVGDSDPRLPCSEDQPEDLACDGRGLQIVRALTDRLWWERAAPGGKIVYARFDLARYDLEEKR